MHAMRHPKERNSIDNKANVRKKNPQRRSRAMSPKPPIPIPIPKEEEPQPPAVAEAMELKGLQDTAAPLPLPLHAEAAEAEPVEGPKRRVAAPKRKAAAGATNISASSKRLAKEKLQNPNPSIHIGPLTRARQSPNWHSNAASRNPPERSPPQRPARSPVGEPIAAAVEPVSVCKNDEEEEEEEEEKEKVSEQVVDEELEAVRSCDANVHVIPTPAGWFSWTRIHSLEERALASFFNGKYEDRTPDIYMEIRNAIMKKFHMDPKSQVELKDLLELSIGNLEARQEVMEFLDHWGLINFHPFPLLDSTMAAFNVDGVVKTASLIEKLYHFAEFQPCPSSTLGTNKSEQTMTTQLLLESTIFEDLVRPEGPSVEYHCNSCSSDCSHKRYHCQTQADFDLCSQCYNDGKFASGMAPTDFIHMENVEVLGSSGGNWTDQETLLLLEALELYEENWNEIAEHVATKTKEQCILHFVQMPIEDSFLDGKDSDDAGSQENVDPVFSIKDSPAVDVAETLENKSEAQPVLLPAGTPKPKDAVAVNVAQETGGNFAINALKAAFHAVGDRHSTGESFSFSEAGNQVMALAVFLAGLVEPDVAAAWTLRSLKAMSEDSPSIQLAARHCFLLEDPPSVKDLACESSVDVRGEPQKEETQTIVMEDCEVLKGFTNKDNENTVPRESELLVTSQECTKTSHVADDSAMAEEVKPSTMKGSNDLALQGDPTPSIMNESGDLASPQEDTQCSELTKTMDMVSDSVPSAGKAPGTEQNIGENDKKLVHSKIEKKYTSLESRDDQNTKRIKRATLTTLSAAAVKAKFLANQEEDEIRELVSLLIGKQLHKLESKLALFSDMESAIMRVKEQLDRGKQRLYQERAQIIAAQLGLPSHASRPVPPLLPTSQIAMNYGNSGLKPPTVSPQKPLVRTTMWSSIPAPSTSTFPGTAAGNSEHAFR